MAVKIRNVLIHIIHIPISLIKVCKWFYSNILLHRSQSSQFQYRNFWKLLSLSTPKYIKTIFSMLEFQMWTANFWLVVSLVPTILLPDSSSLRLPLRPIESVTIKGNSTFSHWRIQYCLTIYFPSRQGFNWRSAVPSSTKLIVTKLVTQWYYLHFPHSNGRPSSCVTSSDTRRGAYLCGTP